MHQISIILQMKESELDLEIKKCSQHNSFVQIYIKEKDSDYREGYLWFKDQIYLLKKVRSIILKELHGSLACGHFGRDKTLAYLKC